MIKMGIPFELSKYMFTPEFSEKVHTFSEQHHTEGLSEFRTSWLSWITNKTIMEAIETEIDTMKTQGYTGTSEDVYKKILISARFYYRKKSKKTAAAKKTDIKKKIYIRLTTEFIDKMDTFIRQTIIQIHKHQDKVKFSQKILFETFTREHIEEIHQELGILKGKYEASSDAFIPMDIATKIAKTFQNRVYIVRSALCKISQ